MVLEWGLAACHASERSVSWPAILQLQVMGCWWCECRHTI